MLYLVQKKQDSKSCKEYDFDYVKRHKQAGKILILNVLGLLI